MDADLLIGHGSVVDGTGTRPVLRDVAAIDGRIHLPHPEETVVARRTIDATGLIVAPGFIDIHAHTDFLPLVDPLAESKLHDGVTLEISGNCGSSPFPLDPFTADRENRVLARFGARIEWSDLATYRARVESRQTAIHRALLVGHGSLRKVVVGYEDRPATAAELDRMCGLLADLLDQGAVGLSTGLIYAPGCYAPREEIVALASVAARRGKMHGSHIRSEGRALIEGIEEILDIAVRSGARTQISHLKASGPANWHKIDGVLERIDRVRSQGHTVMADRYPYTATNTSLDICLRTWVQEGGVQAELRRLGDRATRARILRELREDHPADHFERVLISTAGVPSCQPLEGHTVSEIAAARGLDPFEAALAILEECRADVGAIYFTLNEQIMRKVLCLDYVMVGSDGTAQVARPPYVEGFPHPRCYGTFGRVLGRLVREERLMALETAIHKMTAMPARQLGLPDRGTIVDGAHADLVVFDPATVRDEATYRDPHRHSTGIVHVVVGGRLVVESGRPTGDLPGRVL